MKHEILEEVWRVRDQISAECGHDVQKLGAMLRREEPKYADRLARLPIQRRSAPGAQQARVGRRVQPPTHVCSTTFVRAIKGCLTKGVRLPE